MPATKTAYHNQKVCAHCDIYTDSPARCPACMGPLCRSCRDKPVTTEHALAAASGEYEKPS